MASNNLQKNFFKSVTMNCSMSNNKKSSASDLISGFQTGTQLKAKCGHDDRLRFEVSVRS